MNIEVKIILFAHNKVRDSVEVWLGSLAEIGKTPEIKSSSLGPKA